MSITSITHSFRNHYKAHWSERYEIHEIIETRLKRDRRPTIWISVSIKLRDVWRVECVRRSEQKASKSARREAILIFGHRSPYAVQYLVSWNALQVELVNTVGICLFVIMCTEYPECSNRSIEILHDDYLYSLKTRVKCVCVCHRNIVFFFSFNPCVNFRDWQISVGDRNNRYKFAYYAIEVLRGLTQKSTKKFVRDYIII